jgi:cobalt-precorrin 5A hydrolase
MAGLAEAQLFVGERLADDADDAQVFLRLGKALAQNFPRYAGHLVFAASGIVVRTIAPLLKDKTQDPAIVVLDQRGRWAISLVSGHLGGANTLAQEAASILGGQAVITTATDSAGLPSLEMVALERGIKVENLSALSKVSGTLLAREPVPVFDPKGWLDDLWQAEPGLFSVTSQAPGPQDSGEEEGPTQALGEGVQKVVYPSNPQVHPVSLRQMGHLKPEMGGE